MEEVAERKHRYTSPRGTMFSIPNHCYGYAPVLRVDDVFEILTSSAIIANVYIALNSDRYVNSSRM